MDIETRECDCGQEKGDRIGGGEEFPEQRKL